MILISNLSCTEKGTQKTAQKALCCFDRPVTSGELKNSATATQGGGEPGQGETSQEYLMETHKYQVEPVLS